MEITIRINSNVDFNKELTILKRIADLVGEYPEDIGNLCFNDSVYYYKDKPKFRHLILDD